ncbi:MAG: ferrochelatase [Candidatus Rokubacteria bacterium]|nr:ferrochelatase [Candidatus Rokubacteria bacterium]
MDAVLVIAFGGPTAPDEIRPFLDNVARGRRIPRERLEVVATHYEHMPGGRSPLNDLTFAQAHGLEQALAAAGRPLPVHVGMRNWHPYLREALAKMAADGVRQALGVILSALRTQASWDRYKEDVAEARAEVPGAPEILFAPPWSTHPRYLDAVTARAREALSAVPESERSWTPLVFTAHSVPVAMAEASPYVAELFAASHAVADRLGHHRFSIAYQSRSGNPRERWLEPDVNDVLRSLANDGERHVVVVPIGFVADHVELLYDLDVEARRTAEAGRLTFHRASAVNDHPEFIAALADVVTAAS